MTNQRPYTQLDEWVPLSKVVDYAIIDDYDDAQVMRQRFNNWAIRGYNKLGLNLLRIIKDVLIPIAPATGTGKLPDDFGKEISAGYYDMCGEYIPIFQTNMIQVEKKEVCNCEPCKCKPDHSFCDSVSFERTEEVVTINSQSYTNAIIRRFNKERKTYMEQREEWVYIAASDTVEKRITVKDLCTLETEDCGCVKYNDSNVLKLSECGCCCVWDYRQGFSHRDYCFDESFAIDKENFLIHVGFAGMKYVRLKYWAQLPCVNGQVMFPAVAIETLAAWILYKRDLRRKGIADVKIERAYRHYKYERSELRKNLFPIKESVILNALNLIPY